MAKLEWNDDLALGVDVFDAGHRRLVILLAQAEDARDAGNLRAAAVALGLFLNEFNKLFNEECSLLGTLGYSDLPRRRSEYLTAQAVMSAHPIGEDDIELIAHMVEYARSWLLDHIIRQDMPLASFLSSKGLATEPRRRPWQIFDFIKLRWRIVLLGILPLIMVIGLAFVAYDELHRTVKSTVLLRDMNELNTEIGSAVHELQIEQALSLISVSNPNLSHERLKAQITHSDAALSRLRISMARVTPELTDASAIEALQNASDSLNLLHEIRGDVLTASYDAVQTADFYNTAIEDLMGLVPGVVRTVLSTDFGRDTIAYVFLLEAKELAGRERAIGAAILARGAPTLPFNKATTNIKALADEEESLGKAFALLVAPHVAESYRAAAAVPASLANMRRALVDGDTFGLTAQEWFETASERIDRIHEFEATITSDLAFDVAELEDQARRRAMMLDAGMVLAIILSLAITGAVAWTILPPIRRLGFALRRLDEGSLDLKITDVTARDEIGAIARIVASLRERLVHGDFLEARRWTENAERLRAVADNLPGIVFRVAQPDGGKPVLAAVSRKLRAITGLSSTEAVDVPLRTVLRRIVRPEDRPALLHLLHRSSGRSIDCEFRLRGDISSEQRWLRVIASPMRNRAGWVWDGVALDVTAMKRAEEEQARVASELARLYRIQTTVQLASSVGSELAAIAGPIMDSGEDALQELALDSPVRGKIRTILAAAQKVRRLGERISQISQANSQERTPIDAVAVVEDCLRNVQAILPASVTMEMTLDGRGALILATATELDRLITSLCAYSIGTIGPEGGVLKAATRIAEGKGQVPDQLYISIRDSGPGLEKHTLSRVFAPQFTTRRAEKGGELSLAVARAVVDGCGGWIQAGSKPGVGTFFEVFLPLYRPVTTNVISLRGEAKWQKSRH